MIRVLTPWLEEIEHFSKKTREDLSQSLLILDGDSILCEYFSPNELEGLINAKTAFRCVEFHILKDLFFDFTILHHFNARWESEELEPGRHLQEDKQREEE